MYNQAKAINGMCITIRAALARRLASATPARIQTTYLDWIRDWNHKSTTCAGSAMMLAATITTNRRVCASSVTRKIVPATRNTVIALEPSRIRKAVPRISPRAASCLDSSRTTIVSRPRLANAPNSAAKLTT